MRILVTGGAGFIGSHIVDALSASGTHELLVIDNLTTGDRRNVSDDLLVVDDYVSAIDEVEGFHPDVIVHAAASYRDPDDWAADAWTNALGAANLAHAAKSCGVKKLVYFQTSLCYGIAPPRIPLPETWAISPVGSYAITKTAAEQLLLNSGVPTFSFRLANMYGPRNRSGPIPAFYKRIKAGDRCTVVRDVRRDFMFIDDAVPLFLKAILGNHEPGVYHVSHGHDFGIDDVHALVALAMSAGDVEADYVARGDDDSPSILLDPRKTEREFDWTPSTRLDIGIEQTVDWYDHHDIGETYTHLKVEG